MASVQLVCLDQIVQGSVADLETLFDQARSSAFMVFRIATLRCMILYTRMYTLG